VSEKCTTIMRTFLGLYETNKREAFRNVYRHHLSILPEHLRRFDGFTLKN